MPESLPTPGRGAIPPNPPIVVRGFLWNDRKAARISAIQLGHLYQETPTSRPVLLRGPKAPPTWALLLWDLLHWDPLGLADSGLREEELGCPPQR